ncbi:hypothetical protein MGALJ_44040 [Mycobacterium gallinarum]|uniref:Uncharacterized protein n=1 Tax=Mycobacterium gallinarum TaxID=39689 RepID=A0A9W4FH24_9MYCO|nr:hypothetical protein [Mycobacterium gallinarum]BBY94735.1 hypothetical protein MGALJ_44040 [Mycobacterium gallinarum]
MRRWRPARWVWVSRTAPKDSRGSTPGWMAIRYWAPTAHWERLARLVFRENQACWELVPEVLRRAVA